MHLLAMGIYYKSNNICVCRTLFKDSEHEEINSMIHIATANKKVDSTVTNKLFSIRVQKLWQFFQNLSFSFHFSYNISFCSKV